ncbi:MAG: hypothetical protein ACKOWF_10905 [Chloroflexota bacterium]
MQAREWIVLALLIVVPLIIAVLVTLWSIKQIAYRPKKSAPPKPVLTAAEAGSGAAGAPAAAAAVSAPAAADCETQDTKGRCRH